MDTFIEFKFQGIRYKVSPQALELKKIILPDERILEVKGWFEFDDRPPQIYSLDEIIYLKTEDLSPEQIAQKVKGVLAQPI